VGPEPAIICFDPGALLTSIDRSRNYLSSILRRDFLHILCVAPLSLPLVRARQLGFDRHCRYLAPPRCWSRSSKVGFALYCSSGGIPAPSHGHRHRISRGRSAHLLAPAGWPDDWNQSMQETTTSIRSIPSAPREFVRHF
jgi:hypothetical protein